VVERKTLENLATSISDGSLVFQLQRLAKVGRSAIVVEGDYPDLFRTQPRRGSWLADMLGRLAARYPEVPIVFVGSPRSGPSAFSEQPVGVTYSSAGRLLGVGSPDR
jgi:ERCC4-type nuclease